MIVRIYLIILLQLFAVTSNDYNYVLERYLIEPSSSQIFKSKLCKIFKLLSICDDYNRNMNYVSRIPPFELASYFNSFKRRQRFIHNKRRHRTSCNCSCCTCARPCKCYKSYHKKSKALSRKRRDRRKRNQQKKINFTNIMAFIKNNSMNAYDKTKNAIEKAAYDVQYKFDNVTGYKTPLQQCTDILAAINSKLEKLCHKNALVQWNYESNLTAENKMNSINFDKKLAAKLKIYKTNIEYIDELYNCSDINKKLEREIKLLTKLNSASLPSYDYVEYQNILRDMESIYSKAIIKDFSNKGTFLHLDPGITQRMAVSRNPQELQYIWESWRNETGKKMKQIYPRYIQLMKNSALINGYKDVADMWQSVYEQDNFETKIYEIWEQVKPLYQQLHAYVRIKLVEFYGYDIIGEDYIPVHLLGNIFGQTWINIYNITTPYPNHKFPDVTAFLQLKGYTPLKMMEEAENFFKSLGLPAMTNEFWKNSIIEQVPNVQMVCHASAWDMFDKKDFRIKMCAQVTFEDFIIIHHEMGHILYYMLYNNLPVVFREGANPGFHEAVGDTIALSVSTQQHMKYLGLEIDKTNSFENDINFLYLMALQKIAFLPYALVVETWRWDVFRGNIQEKDYNKHWWFLRNKFQGIKAPTPRTEENFDPGAKYHIAAGVPYIRYFVSFIIQFQFHEALCTKAGRVYNIPLHKCGIYKSKEAGELLKQSLSLGKSVQWTEIMKMFTNKTDISADSILIYFQPLYEWLREENIKQNARVGWDS